jgi:hypothetical protein
MLVDPEYPNAYQPSGEYLLATDQQAETYRAMIAERENRKRREQEAERYSFYAFLMRQ